MHNNEISVKLLTFSSRIQGILTVALWILLSFGFDKPHVAGLTVASALVHECGHAMYANIRLKARVTANSRLTGPRLRARGELPYRGELMLLLSGPLANLALFILLVPLCRISEYLWCFALLNLATAVSNLLPMAGHDGYGIIRTVLEMRCSPRIGFVLLRGLSVLLSALGCVFALFLLDRIGEGYVLFSIFYFSLFSELFKLSSTR